MKDTVPGAEDKRAAQIAEIHGFADWLADNPAMPMPMLDLHRHLHRGDGTDAENLSTVRDLAEKIGAGTDESLDDRTVLRYCVNEHVWYELYAWHKAGRDAQDELERLRGRVAELEARNARPAEPEREGPWFKVGDRVVHRGWEKSQYARAGLNVVGTVVETRPIAGSSPRRQQFRAEGADWCGGGSMWEHSDGFELAPAELVDDLGEGFDRSQTADANDAAPPVVGRRREPHTGRPLSGIAADGHQLGETGGPVDGGQLVDETEPKCTPECAALTTRPEITGPARSFHADNCPVVVHHHVTDGETECGKRVSDLPAAHGYETGCWDVTDCQACIASRAGRCGYPCTRPDGHTGLCSDES